MDQIIESLLDYPDEATNSEDCDSDNDEFIQASNIGQTISDEIQESDQPDHEEDALPSSPFYEARTAALREGLGGASLLPVVLKTLLLWKENGINLPIFLHALSWGDADCRVDPTVRYARTSLMRSTELPVILRHWALPPRNEHKGKRAMGAKPIVDDLVDELVQRRIDQDMTKTASLFTSPCQDTSEKTLSSIRYDEMIKATKEQAPFLWGLIHHMVSTERQRERNKIKQPDLVVLNIISQAHYARSQRRAKLPKLHALYLRASGVSARGFDLVHLLGISMSHKWAADTYRALAAQKMAIVQRIVKNPGWVISHDNVNIPLRVFSQRLHNQSHFINATAITIWVLPKSALQLPINASTELHAYRAQHCNKMFNMKKIIIREPSISARIEAQHVYHVLQFLLEAPDFQNYQHRSSSLFKAPPSVEQLPSSPDSRVTQYMLRTCDIEEASYEGTERVMAEVFRQLKLDSTEDRKYTGTHRLIAWLGDQLTVSRLRGLYRFHAEDLNHNERLDYLLPMFGWFHVLMAHANSLHSQYLGTSAGVGGLRHAFDLIKRKGLLNQHTKGPFWHHVDEALHHVAEAHFRACWLHTGKVKSITELKTRTPEELYALATGIVKQFASREAVERIGAKPLACQDQVLQQAIMFNSDVLAYIELRAAIRAGDVGRIEDMSPTLLYRFAGGGNSNYMIEMLELFQGMYQEWTPEVWSFLKRNCWLLTRTGKINSWLPYDLGQEENIADIKVNYFAQGPGASMEYLTEMSPAIPTLRKIKESVNAQFSSLKGRGSHHSSPDKEQDVATLTESYTLSAIYSETEGRKIKTKTDKVDDYVSKGVKVLLGATGSVNDWFERRKYTREVMESWSSEGTAE